MSNSFIWPIDRTLSVVATLGQSGSGSDSNEEVLRIPQSSSITGASSSNCLVWYLGHSLWGTYSSAEMQSVYSAAPVVQCLDPIDKKKSIVNKTSSYELFSLCYFLAHLRISSNLVNFLKNRGRTFLNKKLLTELFLASIKSYKRS